MSDLLNKPRTTFDHNDERDSLVRHARCSACQRLFLFDLPSGLCPSCETQPTRRFSVETTKTRLILGSTLTTRRQRDEVRNFGWDVNAHGEGA